MDENAARQVLRHPREVAEATAVKQLQERYASLIKFATPARPVYKTVPVHGKVKYFPPGWRLRFRHQELRYISATDVSGAFAAKLGLGANIKPLETVVDGRVSDKQKVGAKKGDISKVDPVEPESSGDEPESDSDDSEAERELDFLILRNMKTEALRDLCRTAGLPDSGSKAVLISLLMNPEEADAEPKPKKRKKEEKEKREKKEKKEKREKREKREKKEMKEMKVKKDKQPKTPEEPKTSKESSGALSGAWSGAFDPTEKPEDELARLEAFLASQDPGSSSQGPETAPREAHERAEMEARMEQEQKEKTEEEARAKEVLAAKKDLGLVQSNFFYHLFR